TALSTVALIGIPKSMQPRSPVKSISLPSEDHSSYQKEVVEPFRISTLASCEASGRSFSSFFHIHEPRELVSFTFQKGPSLMRYL
ncbi:uncharacterized protein LOC125586862, partial [Brassica napus]|uniref:uncharacterized protein LOC125586862 n=1 Tax=Brassica napus TaxID=3708 RepID=UPI00207A3CC2